MLVKQYNIDDLAKIVLPLHNRRRNCQNAYKTNKILMVLTWPADRNTIMSPHRGGDSSIAKADRVVLNFNGA